MKRLDFNEGDKLSDVLNTIEQQTDKEIEIFVFPGSDVLKLPANVEVINSFAENLGKKVTIKGDFGVKSKEIATQAKKEENLGFVEGKDVAGERPAQKEEPEVKKKSKLPIPKWLNWNFLKNRKRVSIALGILGTLVIIILATVWFLPSATVTLVTQAQFKEAELNLVASASVEEADKDSGIIPLKTIETSQEDELEAKATGSKTVGTAAKGRVKIVNRDTTKSKTFFKGTTLTPVSGSKINFSLDKTATISAAPVGCEANCPSAGVDVTAAVIGDSGNLKAGTVFKVGSANVSLVFAKNETNLSGGSSKKITVVSTSDQKKVKKELLEKLEEKASKEIEDENPDAIVPEGGLEPKVSQEVYSKKVGEETSVFRLSLQVEFIAKIFSEEDLKNLLIESISDTVPSDFEIDHEGSNVEAEIIDVEEDELEIIGSIRASLVPKIDTNNVINKIVGKDFSTTERYLDSLTSISGVETKISPSIFRIFGTMPFSRGRIKVKLIQEESNEKLPPVEESDEESEEDSVEGPEE
jgi:hypothetical protein